MKHLLTKILMMGIFGSLVTAQTNVNGVISSNTTWSASNSPYTVTGNVLVSSGVTLTIEAGVTVKFDSDKSLQINGEVIAQGTSSNKITFTSNQSSPAAGDWGSITFSSSSTPASFNSDGDYSSGSIIEHSIIQYAGESGEGAIRLLDAHPFISNNIIKGNSASGIYVYELSGSLVISNNNISSNTMSGYGGGISAVSSHIGSSITIKNNIISNNTTNGGGGGIYSSPQCCAPAPEIIISNNIISNNTTNGDSRC